jgi:hypothetical protein
VTELAVVFLTGFVSVFALGFQSRNVNHGNYGWAAGTSFFVGLSQAALWTHITSPKTSAAAWFVYALSGACAITLSMWVHERYILSRKDSKNGRKAKPKYDVAEGNG